jgi:hypothetical protein
MSKNHKGEASVRRLTVGLRLTALVSVAATLIFAPSCLAGATTINASSASQSDVTAAIASAADGDTVTIPSGTATWTRTLSVTKAITIQGAGVGVTIIKDGVQSGQLIAWSLAAGFASRLTGIEFQDGGRLNTANAPSGIIHVDGNNTDGSRFRFDHCKWGDLKGYFVTDTVIGVIDHNEILTGNRTRQWLYPYGSRWNGGNNGDGSWAAPANYGSGDFLFIEDNTFICSSPSQIIDVLAGGRITFRHNIMRGGITGNHGTESGGRMRSSRAMDIYSNLIDNLNVTKFVAGNRGGSELFHDNTIVNSCGALAENDLSTHRMFWKWSPWGAADGTNGWDKNAAGAPFFSGTANITGNLSVTVNGANWMPNQWAGYTIKKNSGGHSFIRGNNANTINFADSGGYGPNLAFAAGDGFTINKVDLALDQPGAGVTPLLYGDSPRPPRNWNQAIEPCYSWSNTNDGQPFNSFLSYYPNIKQGVHYFNNTPMPGYTPYTYPHPLTKGLPLPEQMTRKAAGNSQPKPVKKRQPWGGKKVDRKTKKAKASPTNEMGDGPKSLGH